MTLLEMGEVITEINSGRPLKPDNMPTQINRIDPNRKPVPLLKVERWPSSFLVNQTLKSILEELEPNTHQFFPMEIFENDEKIADYFWLNVCNRLDTLHLELTYPRNARGFWKPVKGEPSSVVFSTRGIGDHHAWIDKFMQGPGIFISDIFAERLQDAGLTGLNFHKSDQAYSRTIIFSYENHHMPFPAGLFPFPSLLKVFGFNR